MRVNSNSPQSDKTADGKTSNVPLRDEFLSSTNESTLIDQHCSAEAEFIDARTAATWLGIPLRSLHAYVQKRLLPSYKLGRHRLFRKSELLNALGASRSASRDEIIR